MRLKLRHHAAVHSRWRTRQLRKAKEVIRVSDYHPKKLGKSMSNRRNREASLLKNCFDIIWVSLCVLRHATGHLHPLESLIAEVEVADRYAPEPPPLGRSTIAHPTCHGHFQIPLQHHITQDYHFMRTSWRGLFSLLLTSLVYGRLTKVLVTHYSEIFHPETLETTTFLMYDLTDELEMEVLQA